MHELSIAMSIVEIACEESARHGNAPIEAVHLRLGTLSGVVKEALLFSWGVACDGTPAAGSRLAIEDVPVRIWCSHCGAEHTLAGPFEMLCPHCGAVVTEIRAGRELDVTALELGES